jgi:putative endonuclease
MARDYSFFVYILASRSRTLYIGVTNDLRRRVEQHRAGKMGSFTKRYEITRLVYFERFDHVVNAIAREKELKRWTRSRKIELIEAENSTWDDLFESAKQHVPQYVWEDDADAKGESTSKTESKEEADPSLRSG